MILSTTPFDPTEPEEASKGSAYLSAKDLKMIGLILAAMSLILIPVYAQCKKNADEHLCKQNFSQISKAIGLYAQENDDRLPPACASLGDGTPLLDDQGQPFTWASLVSRYMNGRASFKCPAATDAEITRSQHPETTKLFIPTTYGMYVPYSAYPISHISNPDVTVVVSETSNFGAEGSYDPIRFKSPEGRPVTQDGFEIAFSNSNDVPDKGTASVTRLAFRDTANGTFSEESPPRHPNGLIVLTAAGGIQLIRPPVAKITMLPTGEIQGAWAVPPRLVR